MSDLFRVDRTGSMSPTSFGNLVVLQELLALGIAILGLVLMVGGISVVVWLLRAFARLLGSLASALLRGLLIFAIRTAIYLFIAHKLPVLRHIVGTLFPSMRRLR